MWLEGGRARVCSSDLFASPAESHVVAGHPAGCNDRLHSNLPDSQQEKTSSQLLFRVWNDASIPLLCSPHPDTSPAYSLSELTFSFLLRTLSIWAVIYQKLYMLALPSVLINKKSGCVGFSLAILSGTLYILLNSRVTLLSMWIPGTLLWYQHKVQHKQPT